MLCRVKCWVHCLKISWCRCACDWAELMTVPFPGAVQCSGVIGQCLLHRGAVYHIGLCAYVRTIFNMVWGQNCGGSSSLFGWVCTCSTTPYTWISQGKPGQAVPRPFLPLESAGKMTGTSRNPLISTKCTSKTLSGGKCVCICSHTHMQTHGFTLCKCAIVHHLS